MKKDMVSSKPLEPTATKKYHKGPDGKWHHYKEVDGKEIMLDGVAYSIDGIRTALSESNYATTDDNVFKVHRSLLEGTMAIDENGKIVKA